MQYGFHLVYLCNRREKIDNSLQVHTELYETVYDDIHCLDEKLVGNSRKIKDCFIAAVIVFVYWFICRI